MIDQRRIVARVSARYQQDEIGESTAGNERVCEGGSLPNPIVEHIHEHHDLIDASGEAPNIADSNQEGKQHIHHDRIASQRKHGQVLANSLQAVILEGTLAISNAVELRLHFRFVYLMTTIGSDRVKLGSVLPVCYYIDAKKIKSDASSAPSVAHRPTLLLEIVGFEPVLARTLQNVQLVNEGCAFFVWF